MGIFKGDSKQKEMHFVGDELTAALEAFLFLYGDPVEISKVASFLGVKSAKVKEVAEEFARTLDISGRGLSLVFHGEKIQLTTRPSFSSMLDELVKADLAETLTPAALETLAIVAYGAPISRMEIDFIRGVNSSFILRQLLLRGLIERDFDSRRSNAYAYSPAIDFVKYLGLSRIEDLPEYDRFRQIAQSISQEEPDEASQEEDESRNDRADTIE